MDNPDKKIDSVACTLARGTGAAVPASCGGLAATAEKKSTAYEVTLTNLNAGSYIYSVTVTVGKTRGTASTTFTIVPVQAVCTVTPYTVTYDGQPHTATGSCTGVGGVALPGSNLNLTATSHTNAGTYANDAWTFADSDGNYTNPGGSVANTINRRAADCAVAPYHVTYDGTAHSATGSCTGVGGVTLPPSNLNFTGTSHTSAGTYNGDAWTFSDPSGNYSNPGGTVNDAIDQHGQTITFGAAPVDPAAGGSYTPSATATSGFTVSLTISSTASANCSISSSGLVSFLAAGTCTVEARQAGDMNWAASPVASQEFIITSAQVDPKPNPHVDVNAAFDPQSPPLPPDPLVQLCRPQSVLAGGCALNPLDGSVDNYFDARASGIPANPDLYDFKWDIYEPPGLSSLLYNSSGITGYHSPVLHIRPSSLPALQGTSAGSDVFWRVGLTVTPKSGSEPRREVFFRFDYQQSSLAFDMYIACSQQRIFNGVECSSEEVHWEPAAPEGPGRQKISLGPGPVNPQVGGSWTPTATASSGLPVAFAVSGASSFQCSITGGVVTFLHAGPCVVDAEQSGNATWGPALEQWAFEIK